MNNDFNELFKNRLVMVSPPIFKICTTDGDIQIHIDPSSIKRSIVGIYKSRNCTRLHSLCAIDVDSGKVVLTYSTLTSTTFDATCLSVLLSILKDCSVYVNNYGLVDILRTRTDGFCENIEISYMNTDEYEIMINKDNDGLHAFFIAYSVYMKESELKEDTL